MELPLRGYRGWSRLDKRKPRSGSYVLRVFSRDLKEPVAWSSRSVGAMVDCASKEKAT